MNELLKDISAKIPYGPLKADFEGGIIDIIAINSYGEIYPDRVNYTLPANEVKPYLRPMSSMTEEERKEMTDEIQKDEISPYGEIKSSGVDNLLLCCVRQAKNLIDWLDKNRFDYRGLIEKELALEALEGMYKTE